jgi:hypothetical protein
MAERNRSGSWITQCAVASLAVFVLLLVTMAQAPADNATQQAQPEQKLNQAKEKANKYSQKLREIQKAAMEKNPELEKKREELRALQKKKMDELVSENATRKEKIKAIMRLRQDQELMQKRKSLQKDFLKAMEKEDPKTKEYLDKLSEARKTMRRINRNRTGQGGQGQTAQ